MNTDNPLVDPLSLPVEAEAFGPLGGIGDINSDARGSGARYNAGKVPLELIPAKIVAALYDESLDIPARDAPDWFDCLRLLGLFQVSEYESPFSCKSLLAKSLLNAGPMHTVLAEAAAVFDYGRKKYSAWNWSKGMPWSVPIGCAMRHIVFGPLAGEENDKESGLPHRGHFACNIIMLMHYVEFYPEGDDRPRLPRKA